MDVLLDSSAPIPSQRHHLRLCARRCALTRPFLFLSLVTRDEQKSTESNYGLFGDEALEESMETRHDNGDGQAGMRIFINLRQLKRAE